MYKIYEVKLYPNKKQELELSRILDVSRLAYNKLLEMKISAYKDDKKNLSRFDLEKVSKKMFDIPANVRGVLCHRISNAYNRFFRKQGKFPRFKSANRMRSIGLKKYGSDGDFIFRGNKVRLWKPIGLVRFHGNLIKEEINSGRIVKRSTGWYIQYLFEQAEKPLKKRFAKKIGIDLGLKSFLVDSEGVAIKPPKFFRESQQKLVIAQRKLSKAVRGSNRRAGKRLLVARIHEKIANQRKDWLHKLSTSYATRYDLVAVEDLNVKGMIRNQHLSKSISDASWSTFVDMLAYKLKMLGRSLVKVAPHYTSQECSRCGEMVSKSLSVRTHICNCGFVADRDYNAALNILKKAQHGLTARTAH